MWGDVVGVCVVGVESGCGRRGGDGWVHTLKPKAKLSQAKSKAKAMSMSNQDETKEINAKSKANPVKPNIKRRWFNWRARRA